MTNYRPNFVALLTALAAGVCWIVILVCVWVILDLLTPAPAKADAGQLAGWTAFEKPDGSIEPRFFPSGLRNPNWPAPGPRPALGNGQLGPAFVIWQAVEADRLRGVAYILDYDGSLAELPGAVQIIPPTLAGQWQNRITAGGSFTPTEILTILEQYK